MRVLLVEDDVDQLDLTAYALRREGYTVLAAIDGQQALARWEAEQLDIVLLDVNLPKLNGFEVCRRIRQESQTPVITLTARDEDDDVVRGFDLGADDYVTKPFSAKQLTARMKSVLGRAAAGSYRRAVSNLNVGDLHLDLQSYAASKAGRSISRCCSSGSCTCWR